MGKVIVFCADGTWNGPGQPDAENLSDPPTNVFKLFLNLAGIDTPGTALLANEQERVLADAGGAVTQCAKYLHGVGDSSNALVQLLGGAVGAGLIARIVRGYTYISRNYLAGDRIYITGFSRGAYTARALAGMIARMGLLDATQIDLTNKPDAYRRGSAVWYAYRNLALQSNPDWLGRLVDFINDLPGFFQTPVPAGQLIAAPIEVVAVWDTVGSLGIPTYTLQDQRIDLFQFADTALSPVVQHGVHAVAVDERRKDFTPTLWDPDPRILQALFPGCHSDVGGGFPGPGVESGLSDCTLQWMTDQLASRGVTFQSPPVYVGQANCCATAHETWLSGIWQVLPTGPRIFPPGLYLSEEVVQRANAATVIPDPSLPAGPYGPDNLTAYLVAGGPAPGVMVV
jgi:uncharacterized protein (DUF2235 family)